MRIGLSGGPGTGKTLLARAIQRRLQLPLIDEGVREWLATEAVTNLASLTRSEHAALQRQFLRWKIAEERVTPAFVSDRTVVDGVVIATMRLGSPFFRGAGSALYNETRAHAQSTYDVVVVPPPVFSADQDPFRPASSAEAGMEHRAIGRLARCWKLRVLYLEGRSLHDWVSQVERWCNHERTR